MQTSVEDTIAAMVQAWDAGDAAAYAELFTEDATYAMYAGLVSQGREQIRRDHEPVLTRWRRGTRMRVRVTSLRPLDDDTVVVLTEGGIGTRSRIALDKVQTFTFRRQPSGEWLCAAFQNTKKNRYLVWAHARSTR